MQPNVTNEIKEKAEDELAPYARNAHTHSDIHDRTMAAQQPGCHA